MTESLEGTVCIGCGCTDLYGCEWGCCWLRRDGATGVCSECPDHLERWDAGARAHSFATIQPEPDYGASAVWSWDHCSTCRRSEKQLLVDSGQGPAGPWAEWRCAECWTWSRTAEQAFHNAPPTFTPSPEPADGLPF